MYHPCRLYNGISEECGQDAAQLSSESTWKQRNVLRYHDDTANHDMVLFFLRTAHKLRIIVILVSRLSIAVLLRDASHVPFG